MVGGGRAIGLKYLPRVDVSVSHSPSFYSITTTRVGRFAKSSADDDSTSLVDKQKKIPRMALLRCYGMKTQMEVEQRATSCPLLLLLLLLLASEVL